MQYNFDEVIDRRGTDSVKWDGMKNVWADGYRTGGMAGLGQR